MLLQIVVNVKSIWQSKSSAYSSIFMLEPTIWFMLGLLIFSKVGAVTVILLIQRKSTEWLLCFSATNENHGIS